MEFGQIKSAFTAEERKDALERASEVKNTILLELASEAVEGKSSFEIWKYSAEERKDALKKALIMKEPVLIELALRITDDITGLETSLIKHKIQFDDFEFVEKTLQTKKMWGTQSNRCVILALKRQNKDMLRLLFKYGASKISIMKYVFERGQIDNIYILLDSGCKLEFYRDIRAIADGCPIEYIELTNWLFEQMPNNSLSIKRFEKIMAKAKIYGKDHIARHMKNCLEIYKEKFISNAKPSEN